MSTLDEEIEVLMTKIITERIAHVRRAIFSAENLGYKVSLLGADYKDTGKMPVGAQVTKRYKTALEFAEQIEKNSKDRE